MVVWVLIGPTLGGAKANPVAPSKSGLSADEILKKTDEIRNPSGTYRMKVSVTSSGDETYQFEIHIGGKEESLIRTLEPKREVGKNFLMSGADMWAYLPNLRRSVRVTLNQKLTGQAANGDISRTRWYGDYDPVIEAETPTQWVLFLTANKVGLTYEKIRLWVDKDTIRPNHGEYLTKTGKLLKKITFRKFTEIAGGLRPSDMLIENAQKTDEYSVLKILEMESTSFQNGHFSQSNLQ